jgi:hypothetical protein
MKTKLLPIVAAIAALGASAMPAIAKDLRSHGLRPPAGPVQGLPAVRAQPSATLIFATDWRVTSLKKGVLVMRQGGRQCTYTVRASVSVAAGDAADAMARATALTPATGSRVLESGTRNNAAWRVTRPAADRQIRIVAKRVDPLDAASRQVGAKLWLQTSVTAESHVGDECHAGTYRDTVGPGIGDALASARTRAYLNPR